VEVSGKRGRERENEQKGGKDGLARLCAMKAQFPINRSAYPGQARY